MDLKHDSRSIPDGRVVKQKRHGAGFYRLNRELQGDNWFERPQLFKQYERIRIASLGNATELQNYIIIGERPTYPYHLITFGREEPLTAPGYASVSWGFICYWSFDRTKRQFKKAPIDVARVYNITSETSQDRLAYVASAWDIKRDFLVQVLAWSRRFGSYMRGSPLFKEPTFRKLELRYGRHSAIIKIRHVPAEEGLFWNIASCFSGVAGDLDAVVITVLLPRFIYFYQPLGGIGKEFKPNKVWSLSEENPLVKIVSLTNFVHHFLENMRKAEFQGCPPVLTKTHSAFLPMKRPLRFKPGEEQEHNKTWAVAFGAAENVTRRYYLFILSVNIAEQSVKIHKAHAFFTPQPLTPFSWDWISLNDADILLEKATLRLLGGVSNNHECSAQCCAFPESEVKALNTYIGDGSGTSASEIVMEETGIILEGWTRGL